MSLSPLSMSEETALNGQINSTIATSTIDEVQPTKTYYFNIETGEIENRLIDHKDALRQTIFKSIHTPRYRSRIYSDDYGSEIEELIGENLPLDFLKTEITRMIRACILGDDRIKDLDSFVITKEDDRLLVSFRVVGSDGLSWMEEVGI